MATHTVLSNPRPSAYNTGWLYVYYDKQTPTGRNCIAIIPNSLRDVVRRGTTFEESQLEFNSELRASVLTVDFHEPPSDHPALPPERQTVWRDSDYHAPLCSTEDLQAVRQRLESLSNATQAQPTTPAIAPMDPALQTLLDQVCHAYLYTCKRLGVVEKPRAMEAQKILVTCLIPYLKQCGIKLAEEDEKAMSL